MSPALQSSLRHFLTALGAVLVTRGVATESQIVEIAGAVVGLIGAIWGPLDEWIVTHDAKITALVAEQIAARVPVSQPSALPPLPLSAPSVLSVVKTPNSES